MFKNTNIAYFCNMATNIEQIETYFNTACTNLGLNFYMGDFLDSFRPKLEDVRVVLNIPDFDDYSIDNKIIFICKITISKVHQNSNTDDKGKRLGYLADVRNDLRTELNKLMIAYYSSVTVQYEAETVDNFDALEYEMKCIINDCYE